MKPTCSANKKKNKKNRLIYLIIAAGLLLFFHTSGYSQKTSKTNVTDYDGNVYNTVIIGKQIWMAENLKATHYRNGDPIIHAKDDHHWWEVRLSEKGAYCNYNNDENNGAIYGRLYNQYAVTDSRGICPTGWHIPISAEWKILETFLGGNSVVGGKMKEAGTNHWKSPNTGATNESGFSALPGGVRDRTGHFGGIGFTGYFWSSGWTSLSGTDAIYLWLINYSPISVNKNAYSEANGFSVRCIKD